MDKCVYCGNNPVPHAVTKYAESSLIAIRPFNNFLARLGLSRAYFALADSLEIFFVNIFRTFGLAKFESAEKITLARARALRDDAQRRGYKMEVLTIRGKPVDIYRVFLPSGKIIFSSLPRPGKYITGALFWMDDKYILKQKFLKAGIPVAKGGAFTNYKKALKAFEDLEKPVIVKPRAGSRGRHTTTFIYTEEQLKHAFDIAKQLCHWVVMEEHLMGSVYRGTVINGRLVGFLAGDPPRITGDGAKNIKELIEQKNNSKHEKVSNIEITEALQTFISRSGFALSTVLAQGKTIDLSEKIGVSYGGSSEELLERVHPAMIEIMEKAAKVVGDPILGFDLIIQDPTKDPAIQKWGIIECNAQPFINLHHYPLHGEPQNVAKHIWDLFA